MKNTIRIFITLAASMLVSGVALAAITPPPEPPSVPSETSQCKKDGWRDFGDMFKNQGDCVSFVVTNGRNEPDGPPNH